MGENAVSQEGRRVDLGLWSKPTIYGMLEGNSTVNWWAGEGDHGPWSQPALCSCHRAVCRREGSLLTGGGNK